MFSCRIASIAKAHQSAGSARNFTVKNDEAHPFFGPDPQKGAPQNESLAAPFSSGNVRIVAIILPNAARGDGVSSGVGKIHSICW